MTDTSIHPGLAWRPLQLDDAARLSELMNAVNAADGYPAVMTADEARHELTHPEVDLAVDSIGGFDADGRLVARGYVSARRLPGPHVRVFFEGDVHPAARGRGIGSALLRSLERRAEARLRELDRGVDAAVPRLVASHYLATLADRAALFSAAGFSPTRWYAEMHRPLDEPLPDVPAHPGSTFVPWSDDLAEAARQAHNDAFRDHWGSQPIDAEAWQHQHADAPTFRPDLTRLALSDGRVVGYVLCHRYPGEAATGRSSVWLATLGVRRGDRRRGLASALITDVLHAIRAAGIHAAELGVDTDNPSGAVGLYERLGFRETRRWVFTAKQHPPR